MGEVFRAHDAVLAREVAIKVLHRSLAGDAAFVDRFRREARAAAALSHPNIVAVYDWGAVDGIYYMVMEYVRGRGVRELLSASGRLEPAQAAEIVRQTLIALESAHKQGMVHRDIKPENILVTNEGVVKVADFGLARAYADGRATQAGTVTGTVQYLSPEQIRGEPADPRSDLYSLGVVTYELLTGELPFTGDTAMSIAYKHLSDRVPAPSSRVPAVPPELDAFVASATDKDRELRPESAAEMRRDLETLAASLPSARSLASLVGDLPEVTLDDGPPATEAVELTATQTIPQVEHGRRRWRTIRNAIGIVLLVAAVAAAAWGVWTYLVPHHSTIPTLVGVPVDQAKSELEHMGLVPRVTSGAYSTRVLAGEVLKTTPAAGAVLPRGEVVTIVPSLGPPPVPVPSLRGMTLAKATDALTTAGLTVGQQSQKYSKTVPAGQVIAWSPPSSAPQGSAVDLVISQGPPPTALPDVTGKTSKDAQKILTGAGFKVTIVPGFSDTIQKGTVMSTTPTGGSGQTAPYGSEVTLKVSVGPESFPAPNFYGLTFAEAKALAKQYGLRVSFIQVPGSTGRHIVSQLPASGSTVQYDEVIALYYA
jgi:eukaryotic-like serine/threonine-protein kinase